MCITVLKKEQIKRTARCLMLSGHLLQRRCALCSKLRHPPMTLLAWRGWQGIMSEALALFECDTAYYYCNFIREVSSYGPSSSIFLLNLSHKNEMWINLEGGRKEERWFVQRWERCVWKEQVDVHVHDEGELVKQEDTVSGTRDKKKKKAEKWEWKCGNGGNGCREKWVWRRKQQRRGD